MLVDLGAGLTVTENINHGRFGELLLADGRLFQPTQVAEPGPEAGAVAAANALNQILLDDGRNGQNPDPLINPDGSLFNASNTVRSGSTVTGTAVMHFAFNAYRLQPVALRVVDDNPRMERPADVGGSLKVASFNVLNYFTTLDQGGATCGPGALGCRGADSASEFVRQRDKILSALAALDADIVGLVELENNASESLRDLVDGLRTLGLTYEFVDTGPIGTDAIKVGFIYKPATVTPDGGFAVLNATVDPRFLDTRNRPALAQTFVENDSSERLTVAVNHFKSKGSPCDDVGDPDTGDGQGNCNGTRTAAAVALADWLATDPTASNDPDFLILGDLNAYRLEDPIDALKTAGYSDLIEAAAGPEAYSFLFFGQAGYLDHALASASLEDQVTGVTVWQSNSDEPRIIDYNEEFKSAAQIADFYSADPYRASDHDPVIVGLALGEPRPVVPQCDGRDATVYVDEKGRIVGGPQDGRVFRGWLTGTRGADVIVGTAADDRLFGRGGADLLCGGDGGDYLFGGRGPDRILGGDGNDRLFGGWGRDTLDGEAGSDGGFGGPGKDACRNLEAPIVKCER
jgi:predicted extracellular nuclease